MDPILILPEILRQVFSYLEYPDTARISRVCWQWRACSYKYLYNEPMIDVHSVSLVRFLRTLLTPGLESLATHVRILDARYRFCCTRHYCAPEVHDRYVPIWSTGEHALLLLNVLPRLDVLTLGLPDHFHTIEDFLSGTHELRDLPLALRSIRYFSCTWPSPHRGITGAILLTMFRLPCARTLEFHILHQIEVPFPAGTSAVTGLVISNAPIALSSLAQIICIPRALTRLSLTCTGPWHHRILSRLQTALEPVRMTLQELEVHLDFMGSEDEDLANTPFLVLRTWPVLRKLRCRITLLLGNFPGETERHLDEMVPRSLSDLSIQGDMLWLDDDVAWEVANLVEQKQQLVLELQRVCMTLPSECEILLWLRDVAADAGVMLAPGPWIVGQMPTVWDW